MIYRATVRRHRTARGHRIRTIADRADSVVTHSPMCHNALAYPHRKHFMCTAEFIDSLFVFVAVVQVQVLFCVCTKFPSPSN